MEVAAACEKEIVEADVGAVDVAPVYSDKSCDCCRDLEEVQGFDIIKKSPKAVCHDPALEAVVVLCNPSLFTPSW